MNRPKLGIAALVVAVGVLFAAEVVPAEKLRIGIEGAYPPFNFIDQTGQPRGFDVDIAQTLCERMGVECKLVAQEWDGIIPALLAGKFDAIVASMSITEERKRSVAFTDRYYSNVVRFAGPKGEKIDVSREGLAGRTIGAQRATISAGYAEDHYGDVATIKLYDTLENAELDLMSGRIDVLLADGLVLYEWLLSKDGQDFQFHGEGLSLDEGIGVALRKEDDALRERFNVALRAILADGTYERINAKYFPFSIY
jgi:polar amino acid transport system substrate-binding protein